MILQFLLVYPLAFVSAAGLTWAGLRHFAPALQGLLAREEERVGAALRDLFLDSWNARTVVRLQVFGAPAMAVIVLLLTGRLVFALVAGGLLYVLPRASLKLAVERRRQRLEGQVIDLIGSLAATVKSGMSLFQSIEEVATRMPPPISQEFGLVLERVRAGQPLEGALLACDRRISLPNLSLVIQSTLIGEERGGKLTDLLEKISKSLREIHRVEERVKTETSGIRLSSRLMAAMPLVIGLLLYVASPEHVLMLFDTLLGNLILVLVAVLDYIGFSMIKKLSDLEV